uniref:ORF019 n=1 Tax=Spodoptera frugiperda granulovirus TaxID=307454 RepID=A0A346QVT8_9BBAC|nr:ORF019 [Spodoptera frugiperda granulovirus]
MQNIKTLDKMMALFVLIDKAEMMKNGVWRLQTMQSLQCMIESYKRCFTVGSFTMNMIKLNTAVNNRCYFSKEIHPYVKDIQNFFRMVNYIYNRKSPCSLKPNKRFRYKTKHVPSPFGYYHPITFKYKHTDLYRFITTPCKSMLSFLVDDLLISHFANFTDNVNVEEEDNNDEEEEELVDLFPKRTGGEYSFSKHPPPPPPLPEFKFSYGFDKESHYAVLNENRHLFDEQDLKFILHPMYEEKTYKKEDLRRLLLKYHPDKNTVYAPVSAMLLLKCRNLLKKCIVM